jgi:peptidoglycan pentaglycine glycine transferase (the first glycine)
LRKIQKTFKMVIHPLPSNTSIGILDTTRYHAWDEFVTTIPGGNYEQTSDWAKILVNDKYWSSFSVVALERNNQIIGGALIFFFDYRKNLRMGFVLQGPCYTELNSNEIKALSDHIKVIAHAEKLKFITVDVLYTQPLLPLLLKKEGFVTTPEIFPPSPYLECTSILDLTVDEAKLMASFNSGRRKSVKAGLKHAVNYRIGDRNDINVMFNLILGTCARRNISPAFSDINFFYQVWDAFAPKNQIQLVFAEIDNKPICASLGFKFGDTFRDRFWGWSGDFQNLNISDAFTWYLIKLAKSNGFKKYDLVELELSCAVAIESGKTVADKIKSNPEYGTAYYKMSYGGKTIHYPGHFTYFPNKLFTLIVEILFNSRVPIIKKMTIKTWNHFKDFIS